MNQAVREAITHELCRGDAKRRDRVAVAASEFVSQAVGYRLAKQDHDAATEAIQAHLRADGKDGTSAYKALYWAWCRAGYIARSASRDYLRLAFAIEAAAFAPEWDELDANDPKMDELAEIYDAANTTARAEIDRIVGEFERV